MTQIEETISRFSSVSLAQMDSVKLMNRVDTKYVTTIPMLQKALARAYESGFRVLEIDGLRLMPYDSIYFDTADLDMYMMHHNGRLNRTKVRSRQYVSSGDSFLEVKRKNNHGRTKKKRVQISAVELESPFDNSEALQLVKERTGWDAASLSPSLNTSFNRITLVDSDMKERVTIDTSLVFTNMRTSSTESLSDRVIIELKQDSQSDSLLKSILLDLRILPLRVSKYCIGVALTNPTVKQNNFKQKIRTISKL